MKPADQDPHSFQIHIEKSMQPGGGGGGGERGGGGGGGQNGDTDRDAHSCIC